IASIPRSPMRSCPISLLLRRAAPQRISPAVAAALRLPAAFSFFSGAGVWLAWVIGPLTCADRHSQEPATTAAFRGWSPEQSLDVWPLHITDKRLSTLPRFLFAWVQPPGSTRSRTADPSWAMGSGHLHQVPSNRTSDRAGRTCRRDNYRACP